MNNNDKVLSFKGQDFFIGIDVHKKQWTIRVISNGLLLGKAVSIDPSPKVLLQYLKRRYPDGNYYAVYESGFSGFWAARELNELGIECMITHAADVPSSQKERLNKNDKVDAGRLARSLSQNNLKPIYIPERLAEEFRYLSRYRDSVIKDQTRIKNRIKASLHCFGITIPIELQGDRRWSGAFIQWLKSQKFESEYGQFAYDSLIDELIEKRKRLSKILKEMRKMAKDAKPLNIIIPLLLSVTGVGFITAMTFATEIMDMKRFKRLESLANYIGLVPSVESSDEKVKVLGVSSRRNKHLRKMLIEAAWIAVRKDPALTMKYNNLTKRMHSNKAIVRITKILVNRMRHVWNTQQPYVMGIVA